MKRLLAQLLLKRFSQAAVVQFNRPDTYKVCPTKSLLFLMDTSDKSSSFREMFHLVFPSATPVCYFSNLMSRSNLSIERVTSHKESLSYLLCLALFSGNVWFKWRLSRVCFWGFFSEPEQMNKTLQKGHRETQRAFKRSQITAVKSKGWKCSKGGGGRTKQCLF